MASPRREISRRVFLQWGALLGGGAAGLGVLGGCGTSSQSPSPSSSAKASSSASTSASPSASASASASPKPAVKLPATEAAVSHLKEVESMAPGIIAEVLGYFKEVGLDQKMTDFSGGGSEPIRAVLTGSMAYGYGLSTASAITAFMQGQPIRIVGGNESYAGIVYLVKTDSPLKTIDDLKGKKLGFSSAGSVSNFTTATSLRKAGLIDQVQMVPVGGASDSWTAVQGGVIDCGWSANPLAAELVSKGQARVLFQAATYIPDYVNTCTVTTESYLKQNLPVVQAALAALHKAEQLIAKEPEKAAKAWSQFTSIPEDICLLSLKSVPASGWTVALPTAGLKAAEEGLIAMDLIKGKVDWAKLVDQSALPKELQQPLPS